MEKEKKSTRKRKWPVILIIMVLLAGCAIFLVPELAYKVAQDKMEVGEYDIAEQIFSILKDYKDSAVYLDEVGRIRIYEKGCDLMESGNYSDACVQFESLGDYRDSKSLLTESSYQKALSALQYGAGTDHEAVAEAYDIFLSLDGYKESDEYLQQFSIACVYLSRTFIQSGENLGQEPLYYDAQGRLTGKGLEPEQYLYDEEGRLIYDAPDHIVYDEEGRVYQRSNEKRTITYGYDKKGNEVERTYYFAQSGKSRTRPVSYKREYSKDLLVSETFYDDGKLWTVNLYTYDDQGRIQEHTVQTFGGKPYSEDTVYRYSYTEDGLLDQKEYIKPNPTQSYLETSIYGYIWTPEKT